MNNFNFYIYQEEDTRVHLPVSSPDLPRLTAILRTVTTGDIIRDTRDTDRTGRTSARTRTATGTAIIRRDLSRGRETSLPVIAWRGERQRRLGL